MAKYIMALDQGTTSSRCILFDKAGNICSMAQREFEQIYPKPGWVEHNPMEIWSTQYAVMSEAMALVGAKPKDIAGIGITNQRETTIVWDKETGEPVSFHISQVSTVPNNNLPSSAFFLAPATLLSIHAILVALKYAFGTSPVFALITSA